MTDNHITASLVFDGGDSVLIPEPMGTPRGDQMQGSPAEQLTELAGRVCYDSLGKGRPSFTTEQTQGYHDHIKQVGHGSVCEHFNFTVEIPLGTSRNLSNSEMCVDNRSMLFGACCTNRPGVMMFQAVEPRAVRLTTNLRSVREWLNWEVLLYGSVTPVAMQFASMLHRLANQIAPHIIPESPQFDGVVVGRAGSASQEIFDELQQARIVAPITDHERWISMYLTGSRGLSHELVRHGDFTAISQRSTRFVDESEGEWIQHPLLTAYIDEVKPVARGAAAYDFVIAEEHRSHAIRDCRKVYDETVAVLEPWLINRGVDKTTARKQARGAARGYLGNALQTELIFSANVSQWKWMLRQRASEFADAEIRELFCKVLPELQSSRYQQSFSRWSLRPSPDGIGQVAVEGN